MTSIRRREEAGAAGSMENPVGSSAWGLDRVRQYFGDPRTKNMKPGRYMARPDLCQYGLREPGGESDQYCKKGIIIVATYQEIIMLHRQCQKDASGKPSGIYGPPVHVAVRGSVKTGMG